FLPYLSSISKGQDTIYIHENFKKTEITYDQLAVLSEMPDTFEISDLTWLDFRTWNRFLEYSEFSFSQAIFFKFLVKNTGKEPLELSMSINAANSGRLYTFGSEGELRIGEELFIRGLNLFGRINLQPNETKKIYFEVMIPEYEEYDFTNDLRFRIHNYSWFIEKELSSRFIHSLLLGLLLFSAFLNLILGIILKRRSFFSLFFYLLSLLLFSFSYLGFYDEFIIRKLIRIPIGLPVYFLTLVLFLQVSKKYLQLEKNLPGWNTVTNVLMFFLLLSIPYYYLTVYIEKFYNSFLAFSSLFFFVIAAILGLIESLILFRKEPKAKFFLVANLVVVISLIINIFLDNRFSVVVGSVIQGFIFTIGLAEEIKILDKQKIKFQLSYINQLELNLKLKDNLTSELEKKVEERTHELKRANAELLEKNNIVEQQKELLEIRSKEIKDSIEYAKRIQTASFPSRKILEKISQDYFILYKPRDIVSGDFYWFGEVDDKIIIIAADSTGHGVPGAFMSMYGIAFLNEIVNKQKIYRPDQILGTLREKIAESLNRGDDEFETMDGMDMSVLTFDINKGQLLFAGAFNSLYLIRNEELQIIKADKMPVAFFQKMDSFTLHEIELRKDDCYYIFTDGFIDQFGGAMGKKFLTRRLQEVLVELNHQSMENQCLQLNS
ncbi:MAG: SpoIIE family protein phosphatase, partial [Bacteroidales bacterium]|nr:SpoIIE family protein phosphatase [Bacteroidales bacterium]